MDKPVSKAIIFTDGACKGNPGPGGWAAVLYRNGEPQVVSGGDRQTTNNRMELMGAIEGLEAASDDQEITIYSDSTYLVNTMTKGWKRKANHDLWQRLDDLARGRNIDWKWVRGHNGTPGNELADKLATKEADLAEQSLHPSTAPRRTKI